jgi:hypothetical protein
VQLTCPLLFDNRYRGKVVVFFSRHSGFVDAIYLVITVMISIFDAEFIITTMSEEKNSKVSSKNDLDSQDEMDNLYRFIEKKKIQNEALKKIVDKFNSPEKHKNNK